jgi:rod shape-determining protein MreD
MRGQWIIAYVLLAPIVVAQTALAPAVSLGGVAPDFIAAFVVFYALYEGQLFGTALGFVAGVAYDLASGGVLGVTAFGYTFAGFAIGYFHNENKTDINIRTYRYSALVLLAAFLTSTVTTVVANFDPRANIVSLLVERALTPAIYTAFLSSIVSFVYPKRGFD